MNENSHRIASPGRDCHVRQVIPDRHPATVRNKTTLKVATWNVRTLFQNGKFYNVIARNDKNEDKYTQVATNMKEELASC